MSNLRPALEPINRVVSNEEEKQCYTERDKLIAKIKALVAPTPAQS